MSLSRRKFLVAGLGAVVVAAGAGGYKVDRHPTVLHRLGLDPGPNLKPASQGVQVHKGTMQSAYMKAPVPWEYTLPAGEAAATVFCLHGRGDNCSSPFEQLQLQDMVALQKLPLAVAAVNGGEEYWHKRANGDDPMAMFINEFVPMIEGITKTGERAVFGWSMGGYGALLAAETYPTMFDAVVALSPALWTTSGQTAPGAFDDADDYNTHDVFAGRSRLKAGNVRISCGTSDPFYKATKTFVGTLLPDAQVSFGAGFHEFPYWRSVSPVALNFIASKISRAS